MELTNTEPTLDYARTGGLRHRRQSPRPPTSSRGVRGRFACLSLARRARARDVRARRPARHLTRQARQTPLTRAQPEPNPAKLLPSHARSMPARLLPLQAVRISVHAARGLAAPGTRRGPRDAVKPPVSIPPPRVESCAASARPAARQPERAPARLGSQGLPGPAGAGEEDATGTAAATELPRSAPRPEPDDHQAASARTVEEDTSTSAAA